MHLKYVIIFIVKNAVLYRVANIYLRECFNMAEKKGFIKNFMSEFKEFALKGNVMDMAIGVIIGAAFGNIVTSLTDNFINPLIGVITGGAKKDPETGVMQVVGGKFTIRGVDFSYGAFVSAVINFLVIALILFLMLKAVNGAVEKAAALAKKNEEEAAPTTKTCPYCLMEDIKIEATRCPHCTSSLLETTVEVKA